jgi:hypothetical protein
LGSSPLGSARHPSIAVDRIRIAEVSYWRTPISPGTIMDLRQIRHVTHPQLIRNSIRLIGSSYLCRAEAKVRFVLLSGKTQPTGLRSFSVYENRALRSSSELSANSKYLRELSYLELLPHGSSSRHNPRKVPFRRELQKRLAEEHRGFHSLSQSRPMRPRSS